MFNTLGFVENPHANLIFWDFERNVSLQLIGRPEILWELDHPTNDTNESRRYWTLFGEQWLETSLSQSFRSRLLDYSPYNPSEDGCSKLVSKRENAV